MHPPIYPHRFELFNIGHKVIIISVIPSFVSDRYSHAPLVHTRVVQHTPVCNKYTSKCNALAYALYAHAFLHRSACTCTVHICTHNACTHICSTTSFLLVAFLIEYISVLVTSNFRPFVEPSLDRLNMGTLFVTCLVLFYG